MAQTAETVQMNKGILERIQNVIYKAVDDLSYVEVITATGKTDIQSKTKDTDEDIVAAIKRVRVQKEIGEFDLTMMARTRIEIDGDILMLIPGSKGEPANIREENRNKHPNSYGS
jgi:hypothetical protein